MLSEGWFEGDFAKQLFPSLDCEGFLQTHNNLDGKRRINSHNQMLQHPHLLRTPVIPSEASAIARFRSSVQRESLLPV